MMAIYITSRRERYKGIENLVALVTKSSNHSVAKDGNAVQNLERSCLHRTDELSSEWASSADAVLLHCLN